MAEKTTLLILRLEGILQSWGEMSKWDFRDTSELPTKSGIVGLLGCAMGLERDDARLAELNKAIKIAIRADRPGVRIVDFQTVTGNPLRKADGKPRANGNTIISRHAYLQDASFTIVIETSPAWKLQIVSALRHPIWSVYLGRKCCVPSRPVLESENAEYSSLEDAIIHYPLAERSVIPFVYEIEQENTMFSSLTRPDSLLESSRYFALRKVLRGITGEDTNVSFKN